jgi:hypothetical protein
MPDIRSSLPSEGLWNRIELQLVLPIPSLHRLYHLDNTTGKLIRNTINVAISCFARMTDLFRHWEDQAMKVLFRHGVTPLFLASMISILLTCPVRALSDENAISIGSDDGSMISLKEGEVLQLSLTTNPSTGYDWGFATTPNSSVIR